MPQTKQLLPPSGVTGVGVSDGSAGYVHRKESRGQCLPVDFPLFIKK